ncbi:phosphatidate cytidylyltransferase [Candidatus Cloacimonadota bacterium]
MKLNLVYRILLGVVFIPVILLLFYLGGWFLMLFLFIVVGLQSYELKKLFSNKNVHVPNIIIPLNLLFLISFALKLNIIAPAIVLFTILLLFLIELIKKRMGRIINTVSASLFIMFYSSLLLSFIYSIRLLENGRALLMSLMILIWITDTAAYFSGSYLGSKRNIIAASPGKSLEGFIGGLIGGIGGAFICGYFCHFSTTDVILLGISTGIFGQFGDLMESLIKRDFGVKDSSHILPGHGGILDRFDSLTIAAPVFYVIYKLLGI